jgi:hypothetical protein
MFCDIDHSKYLLQEIVLENSPKVQTFQLYILEEGSVCRLNYELLLGGYSCTKQFDIFLAQNKN